MITLRFLERGYLVFNCKRCLVLAGDLYWTKTLKSISFLRLCRSEFAEQIVTSVLDLSW